MIGSFVRGAQAFGGAAAVRVLPVKSFAIAIRAEHHAFTIRCPCRSLIFPSKSKAPNRRIAVEIVYPDVEVFVFLNPNGDMFPVWRNTRTVVITGGNW